MKKTASRKSVKWISVYEAKTHFSRLLLRVISGEEVVISKAGKPVARLVPYETAPARRVLGQDEGHVRISDDFDAPLPDDWLAELER